MASEERLFGIWNELYGLDPDQELKTVAAISDDSFAGYGSLIATDSRLLALNDDGEFLLLDTEPEIPEFLSRLKLQENRVQVLLHPAIAGDAIYVRLGNNLVKLRLQ